MACLVGSRSRRATSSRSAKCSAWSGERRRRRLRPPTGVPAPSPPPLPAAARRAPVAAGGTAAVAAGGRIVGEPDERGHGAGRAGVRRLAEEQQIDLTGRRHRPGGRVTREDVSRPRASSSTPTAAAGASRRIVSRQFHAAASPRSRTPPRRSHARRARPREKRIRMSRRRQTIAQRLVEAQQTAAMLTTFNEVDMSAIMEMRKRRRKEPSRSATASASASCPFSPRPSIGALKAFPRVNAEIQGDEMVLKKYYDIGIAVGAEEGLVVPVVRDADRKTFAEIEQRDRRSGEQGAREHADARANLQGGTFTITNGGIFGSLLSTPILNAPQVGILGMHTIKQRPIAVER